jgi:hypothetical protein
LSSIWTQVIEYFSRNVLISSASFKILDFHSLLLTRRWHCKQSVNNILCTMLYLFEFVAYYRFLFMWYDGIVPILYLDDGRDYRLSPVELILYMWQILRHEDKIYVMNNFQDKSSLSPSWLKVFSSS